MEGLSPTGPPSLGRGAFPYPCGVRLPAPSLSPAPSSCSEGRWGVSFRRRSAYPFYGEGAEAPRKENADIMTYKLSRTTKHQKPRFQFRWFGFNAGNSCWIGPTHSR